MNNVSAIVLDKSLILFQAIMPHVNQTLR